MTVWDGYLWEVTGPDTQRVVIEGGIGWPGGVALAEAQGRTNLVVVDTFAIRKFDPDTGEAISAVRDVTMATDVGWMLTVSNHGKQLVTSSWTGNFIKLWDPIFKHKFRNTMEWLSHREPSRSQYEIRGDRQFGEGMRQAHIPYIQVNRRMEKCHH